MPAGILNIGITGLLATDNPHPGPGIARCLRMAEEFRGELTGLVFEPLSTGVFSAGLFDRAYVVPYPAAGHDALLYRLEEIHGKTPLDVIIPSLDSEVLLYARLQDQLAEMGIRVLLPPVSQVKLRAKNLLYEFAKKSGVRVPQTFVLNSVEEVRTRAAALGCPFVLKGVLSDARICPSVEEGLRQYGNLLDAWGYPILMQRYVSGEEFDVIALMDKGQTLVGAVAMKKIGLTEKGKAFAGVTIDHDRLIGLTAEILEKLHWIGPAECEFMRDEEGDFHLMEVNGRFPSWLYLAAVAGQNLPFLTVQLALDRPVSPQKHYRSGKLFVRTVTDSPAEMGTLIDLFRTGEVTL